MNPSTAALNTTSSPAYSLLRFRQAVKHALQPSALRWPNLKHSWGLR